jgi:hypothetical protein
MGYGACLYRGNIEEYGTILGGTIMQHGGKYPKRKIITTNDSQKSEAFYSATDEDAPLELSQFAAGTIQHPGTQLYQVWISTNGLDVTCVSAHRDKSRAETALQEVKALISSDDLYDEEKVVAVLQKIKQESDAEPSALPDDLVRQILREILRAVVDRPSQ